MSVSRSRHRLWQRPSRAFGSTLDALHVVGREDFTERVAEVVSFSPARYNRVEPVDWDTRSRAFERAALECGATRPLDEEGAELERARCGVREHGSRHPRTASGPGLFTRP